MRQYVMPHGMRSIAIAVLVACCLRSVKLLRHAETRMLEAWHQFEINELAGSCSSKI